MYNLVYNRLNLFRKKLNLNKIKKFKKKIIWFFIRWNAQGQYRSNRNLSKSYILNQKLWYFQKKKNIQIPAKYKISDVIEIDIKVKDDNILKSKIKWLY